jgi:hypothetical protein
MLDDLIGKTFGTWVVLHYSHKKRTCHYYECQCGCGLLQLVRSDSLKSGRTSKCKACLALDTIARNISYSTHKQSRTPIHLMWSRMKRRPKDENKNYLVLGIKVCKEWETSFETFRDWALANGYDDSLTLERKNVYGDYDPSNCTFVTNKKQQANKLNTIRLPDGSMAWDLAQQNGITRSAFDKRLKNGWDLLKVCTTPLNHSKDTSIYIKYKKKDY